MFASRMCCPRRFPQSLERTLGDGPASAQEAPWPPEPPPGLPELLATAEGLAKGPLAAHGLLNMQSIDATAKLQTLQMEREDDRHRQLIDSIDNVAQAVEDSSAFAQCKKLVERHPFLTGLLGLSIALRLSVKLKDGFRL